MTVDRQNALVSYVAAALRRARTPKAHQRPMEFFYVPADVARTVLHLRVSWCEQLKLVAMTQRHRELLQSSAENSTALSQTGP